MTENCPHCKVHRGHRANCPIGKAEVAPDAYSLENYRAFLRAKCNLPIDHGVPIELDEIFPNCIPGFQPMPHDYAAVAWAVRGGRRALFESFGLHKTVQQLEILRLILKSAGGRGLIVAPLGVRREFAKDAANINVEWKFIRSIEGAGPTGIYLTNYETVRDGKLDPRHFTVATLDEAAILSSFGGTKTFREFMRLFESVQFRYVATATPDPNEYIELLSYAAFLGIMDVSQAKTRFFKRDSTKADKLTLHAHKEAEFWMWCASWALFLHKPSDLGFPDTGYDMPALNVVLHEIAVDHSTAQPERDGQMRMYREARHGVTDAAREKRDTLPERVAKMKEIVINAKNARAESSGQSALLRESSGEDAPTGPRLLSKSSGEEARQGGEAPLQPRIPEAPASPEAIAGTRSEAQSGETGEVCNEPGDPEPSHCSGESVAGEESAREKDSGSQTVRLDDGPIRSATRSAGRGLRHLRTAGSNKQKDVPIGGPLPLDGEGSRPPLHGVQQRSREVQGRSDATPQGHRIPDQFIVWCDLNDEQRAVDRTLDELGISYSSLYGAQPIEEREVLLEDWRNRATTAFVSKPMMYGAGVNLQQCSTAIFLGIGFKFRDWIQAIARIHRFLQKDIVTIHLIYAESERLVLANLMEKWERHKVQTKRMSDIIREYGLSQVAMQTALARRMGVDRQGIVTQNTHLVNNDTVEEIHADSPTAMKSDSVHLILTSIPFSTQYEYTPSYNDFGHTDSNEHFFEQMDFLTPQLLRVLKPGRVCAIHVKDRIVPGGITGLGFQTVYPFHCRTIDHFVKHGFGYMGMKTIVTDVVRENNQTYRLGWTEQCKDGSKMGVGMPEYLLIFRKPPTDTTNSYADEPVVKNKPLCIPPPPVDEHGEPVTVIDIKSAQETVPEYDQTPVPYQRNGTMIAGTGYSRGRWQLDAHGFERSSGNRLLKPEELEGIAHHAIYKKFRAYSQSQVYDYEHHVAIAESLEAKKLLPVKFMLLPPQSWHPDVWTDITRMRTLNGAQSAKGREPHLCPMQFDIANRVIVQNSMEGETVFDPFGGLMTVPYCAVPLKRKVIACELSPDYFRDGVAYVKAAEDKAAMPTLFDTTEWSGELLPDDMELPEDIK